MNQISKLFRGTIIENSPTIKYLSLIILTIIVIIVCFVIFKVSKKVVDIVISKYIKKSKSKFDDILYEKNFYKIVAHTIPVVIIYFVAPFYEEYAHIVKAIADTYLILVLVQLVVAVLDSIDELYKSYEISKTKPITGVLQVVKVVVYIVAGIIVVANIMGENPLGLLGGIGALSAVFSLVFKDPILGFVAGIQLTSTDMLRVGDWISVPKYNAEGDVTEIALTTISLVAFDRSTVTIPNYSLITDSFINYRGMFDSGGRRIKRSFYVDINSIKLCTQEMLDDYKKIDLIRDYIIEKEKDITAHNTKLDVSPGEKVNGRSLTNIGVFRVYLQKYAENHPKLHKDMTLMVRQLGPEETGVPIEIYAFTNTTNWVEFEDIQSDIFDHVLSVADEFYIRLYQRPSGYDIQYNITKNGL